MYQAKLAGIRPFLYKGDDDVVLKTYSHASCFLLNHVTGSNDSTTRAHLSFSDPIFVLPTALLEKDYHNVAKQVISSSKHCSLMFGFETRELLARQISDHIETCFKFVHMDDLILSDLPTYVFVVDIIIIDPPPHHTRSDSEQQYHEQVHPNCSYLTPCENNSNSNAAAHGASKWGSESNKRVIDAFMKIFVLPHVEEESNADADEIYQVLGALRLSDEEAKKAAVLLKIRPTLELIPPPNNDYLLGEDGDCCCSICYETMSSGSDQDEQGVDMEITRLVRCNHKFHTDCILKWLLKTQLCPYCRSSTQTILLC